MSCLRQIVTYSYKVDGIPSKIREIAYLISFTLLLNCTVTFGQSPGPQDCIEAIPLCNTTFINSTVYTGVGSIPNEINGLNSCLLTGERNDAWYIFNITTSGNLSFSIIPAVLSENYDWALYDLTSSNCSDIFNSPSIEVSCNYSNSAGVTGANGLTGVQNEPIIPVFAGNTYVLNISGFSAVSQSGYTIDLTASTAVVSDNSPPSIANVTSLNCGANSLVIKFDEKVLCSTVQPSDFIFNGPGGPYTITAINSSECASGASSSKDFILSISPSITSSGAFSFGFTGSAQDLCGNASSVIQNFPIQINPLTVNISKNDVTCFGGNNGSATATINSGTGPFTYQWAPSGGTGATAQFLIAGTYTVTVTSQSGCSAQSTVNITQPSVGMAANVTTTPANGCAANGSASVTVQNGQAPFTYSWWPTGGNSATANNLSAGGYMVTITDANQCVLNYFLNVPSINGPSASINTFNDVTCFGGNDGSATVTVSGATGPFTYSWSPSGGNNATANNLTAGNYSVIVTINAGCTVSASVLISEPSTAVSTSANIIQPTCGNNNGSIAISPSGGVPGYSYQWMPSVTAGNSVSSLPSGNYTCTISDSHGCTVVENMILNASSAPVLSVNSFDDVTCNGSNDGNININVSGGQGPYTYSWSNGATSQDLLLIGPGTYTVTVTDVAGCTDNISQTIFEPSAVQLSVQNVTHVLCSGEQTGSISMNGSGGSGTLSWVWSGGISTTSNANNLSAGSYTVTVTDQNGCSNVNTIAVNQPSSLMSNSVVIVHPTCGLLNGSISISTNGGTSPYTYAWNPAVSSSSTVNNVGAGAYSVLVTDDNGCTETVSEVLQAANAPILTIGQVVHVSCFSGSNGSISTSVAAGSPPYNIQWSNGATTQDIQNLPNGTYTITVTDQAGCSSSNQVTVTEPDELIIQMPPTQTICIGESVSFSANVSGGTVPYSYSWSNGISGASIQVSPSVNSVYSVIVTDDNGCVKQSASASVNLYPPLELLVVAPDSACSGSEVTINIIPVGGNGNYSLNWSNGMSGISNSIQVNNNQSITITLTDDCGTPVTDTTILITAIDPPSIYYDVSLMNGCAPFEVLFTIPNGVVSGYSYLWDFGDGNISSTPEPSHVFSTGGLYSPSITVTANVAGSCSNTFTAVQPIEVFAGPQALFVYDPPNPTLSFPTVYFQDMSSNANTWSWDFGDGNLSSSASPAHTFSDTGNYMVTLIVTDNSGCIDTVVGLVTVRDDLQIFIPNAFTPDGTGTNDLFKVYGVGFTTFEMTIFDRWGNRVFNSSNKGWDGNDYRSGKPLRQGLYIYNVAVTDKEGELHQRTGRVTLLR